MVNETEFNILKLLASRVDVKWNWYTLDRAMSSREMDGIGNVARLVKNLEEQGLVDFIPSTVPSMPTYRVSEKGYEYIKNMDELKES
ncbi:MULTISPECIES: hypothetical protein [Citrobacter]|uniref:hypothetical protein n=1 Tax=Citrobacter TaxID=544 RepID=UPI0005A65DF5|nr:MULTISPECIES: hypothetical protein [Citrobacter]EHG7580994.1 hypothetical protein [Citrobacter sedlakii]EIQ7157295.1 hypothetical protein [Citrobacter sedlakii]MBN6598629.1 hypothetical protein [Citrobacter sedlakii]QMK44366.1 hypothetical protein HVX72_01280 [Citrobacter sp. RHB21-C05]QMK62810.1 hypothetical protein HVX68_01280 [Citrobacter sp. RHB21-C01]